MPKSLKKVELTEKFATLQIMGAEMCGHNVENALAYVGEKLTSEEWVAMKAFWNWLTKENKRFGSGNIHARWAEWKKSLEVALV